MNGRSIVSALKEKFKVKTDRAIAARLGITTQAIQNWKNRSKVTQRQLVRLVHSAAAAGAMRAQAKAIRPLVEFYPITKTQSKQGGNFELFGTMADDGKKHPYFAGLRDELENHHGVYIFFDSRGQAIYVGRARRQSIWKEMNLAFNRPRGDVQKIKRVRHPQRKQPYRTSDEKARQIGDYVVPLSELATYFSAYDVEDGMINSMEAMLVRSFANDLLNTRMERFSLNAAAA